MREIRESRNPERQPVDSDPFAVHRHALQSLHQVANEPLPPFDPDTDDSETLPPPALMYANDPPFATLPLIAVLVFGLSNLIVLLHPSDTQSQ